PETSCVPKTSLIPSPPGPPVWVSRMVCRSGLLGGFWAFGTKPTLGGENVVWSSSGVTGPLSTGTGSPVAARSGVPAPIENGVTDQLTLKCATGTVGTLEKCWPVRSMSSVQRVNVPTAAAGIATTTSTRLPGSITSSPVLYFVSKPAPITPPSTTALSS